MTRYFRIPAIAAPFVLIAVLNTGGVRADDTEILVPNPQAQSENRPNMLFIADTSRSMRALVSTQQPYDSTQNYAGDCDLTLIYWTTNTTTPPSCNSGNRSNFDTRALVCAKGRQAIIGGGYYSDILAQYYAASGGDERWNPLSPDQRSAPVECRRDAGDHGATASSPDVFAQRGATGSAFTNNPAEAVTWGGFPTQQSYTLYSGNYLNWLQNPTSVDQTRIEVVQTALRSLVATLQDTNVGLARFNGTLLGGTIIEAVQDLDATGHRADLGATIDNNLNLVSTTPLSETLYEASQYWAGRPQEFGLNTTDADAITNTTPANYVAPSGLACTRNFQILLSDGAPNEDTHSVQLTHDLPGFAAITGNSVCTGFDPSIGLNDFDNTNGVCLDDIAAYLARPTASDTAKRDAKTNSDVPDVTTYTIGFNLDPGSTAVQRLQETAARGGGAYFTADNLFDLQQAFDEIRQAEIIAETSFTSPTIAVNAFNRTRNLDDLYFNVFQTSSQLHWPGNLKRYRLLNGEIVDRFDTAAVDENGLFREDSQSIWSTVDDGNDATVGGAAGRLPAIATRRVLTNVENGAVVNRLNIAVGSNAGRFNPGDLGLTGGSGEPTKAELLDWISGRDVKDIDEDRDTAELRKQMGDPLHSQATTVIYGGTANDPVGSIYFGTNDGFLHAIDMETGIEEWSFVPAQFLREQYALFINGDADFKHYGVDGNMVPVIFDRDRDGNIEPGDGDFAYLVFGMRRGGNFYVALDISDKDDPSLAWQIDASDVPGLGQTWSAPVATQARVGNGNAQSPNGENIVLLFGGGYDSAHDIISHPASPDGEGAGVYMVDIRTGDLLWAAGAAANPGTTNNTVVPEMTRAIPGGLTVLDLSGDGLADRIYAGDMGGQIMRFDLFNGASGADFGTGGVIAQFGAEGTGSPTLAQTRRFYTTPDVTLINDPDTQKRFLSIGIGSGYRAHPLDTSVEDKFFSLRDPNVFNQLTQDQFDSLTVATIADLVTVDRSTTAAVQVPAGARGWMLPLRPGEKALSSATTFQGVTFFSTFDPDQATADPCSVGLGLNRLYRVSPATGVPFLPDGPPAPGDDDSRSQELTQTGIVSDPVILFNDKEVVTETVPPRPADCPAELSDKECACLDDPTLSICSVTSCEDDPATAGAVVCVANSCTSLPACLRPVRTIWNQEGVEQ